MTTQIKFSLSDVLSGTHQLTDEQKQSFVEVFGYRCHERTKRRLQSVINYPTGLSNYGIYSRVMFDSTGCSYCAGQSYLDEIRTVRKLICQ